MSNKSAIIYARVSDQKQVKKDVSIQAQLESGRKKAQELDAEVSKEFIDEAKSAFSSAKARQSFLAAIEYCELMAIDYLIVWSSSRFARNRFDAVVYKHRLDQNETQLIYIAQPVDRNTEMGRMMDGFLEIVDEMKSIQTSADTTRSMIKNAKDGYWNGGCTPFGFSPVRINGGNKKKLAANPLETPIVLDIFKMRSRGKGCQAIADTLNARGIINRTRTWKRKSILDLLKNEIVIGRTIFGRKNRRSGKKRPRSEWVICKSHDSIIPVELWKKVQKIIENARPTIGNASGRSTRFLSGIICCGHCGSRMTVSSGKGRKEVYYYYRCLAAKTEKIHKPVGYRVDQVDAWLLECAYETIFNTKFLTELIQELKAKCGGWSKGVKKRQKLLLKKLGSMNVKNSNLFAVMESFGKDVPNLGDLTKRLRDNNKTIKKIENDLILLESERAPETDIPENDIQAMRKNLIRYISSADRKKVRNFFAHWIIKVELLTDHARITYEPEGLVVAVRSKDKWLPEADKLRTTMTIEVGLPAHLQKKVA